MDIHTNSGPLVYIHLFKFAPGSNGLPDPGSNMYRFVRTIRRDGSRAGLICPLNHLYLPVELIPVFGKKCSPEWTCHSALELAKEFRLNCFDTLLSYMLIY